jgi:hypothetical protein
MTIFLFCGPQSLDDRTGFDHQIISLAEGLTSLGINIISNRNYWITNQQTGNYLVKRNAEIVPQNCDVVVFSTKYYKENKHEIPLEIFAKNRKCTNVCIDGHDGLITPSYEIYNEVDIVLKCHYNSKFSYPVKFHPWQFGLSNRIIRSTSSVNSKKNVNEVLVNYRVMHAVRKKASKKIIPLLQSTFSINNEIQDFNANIDSYSPEDVYLNRQTGNRHNPQYYENLKTGLANLCFGGFLTNRFMMSNKLHIKILRKINYDLEFIKNDRVFQWDSWRLWETMSAGAAAIHLDFDKYGMELPTNPVNGVHYLGVDFDNLHEFEEQLKDLDHLRRIGKQGAEWVIENYSPKAIAQRLLDMILDK